MLISILLFTLIMIIVFCVKSAVPDELIVAFFAFWGVEGGAMTWIKNTALNRQKRKKAAEKQEKERDI